MGEMLAKRMVELLVELREIWWDNVAGGCLVDMLEVWLVSKSVQLEVTSTEPPSVHLKGARRNDMMAYSKVTVMGTSLLWLMDLWMVDLMVVMLETSLAEVKGNSEDELLEYPLAGKLEQLMVRVSESLSKWESSLGHWIDSSMVPMMAQPLDHGSVDLWEYVLGKSTDNKSLDSWKVE